jgi:hypothetical protein
LPATAAVQISDFLRLIPTKVIGVEMEQMAELAIIFYPRRGHLVLLFPTDFVKPTKISKILTLLEFCCADSLCELSHCNNTTPHTRHRDNLKSENQIFTFTMVIHVQVQIKRKLILYINLQ